MSIRIYKQTNFESHTEKKSSKKRRFYGADRTGLEGNTRAINFTGRKYSFTRDTLFIKPKGYKKRPRFIFYIYFVYSRVFCPPVAFANRARLIGSVKGRVRSEWIYYFFAAASMVQDCMFFKWVSKLRRFFNSVDGFEGILVNWEKKSIKSFVNVSNKTFNVSVYCDSNSIEILYLMFKI